MSVRAYLISFEELCGGCRHKWNEYAGHEFLHFSCDQTNEDEAANPENCPRLKDLDELEPSPIDVSAQGLVRYGSFYRVKDKPE